MTTERRLQLLTLSNLAGWALITLLVTTGFAQPGNQFAEIETRRLRIVGDDGKAVVVLASRGRLPGPSLNGKTYPPAVSDGRELMSGMIFFNDAGDEVGGLIFNGMEKAGGGYSSVGHFSFDQWKQNQVVALQYIDSGNTRRAGLNVWDRPTTVPLDVELDRILKMRTASGEERARLAKEAAAARENGEAGVQRLFVGSQDKTAQIRLHDSAGRPRVRLFVDADNVARLQFLDANGKVTAEYPPPQP